MATAGVRAIGRVSAVFARLRRLGLREVLRTLHATAAMVVVELLVRRVRLPRLAALLGVPLEAASVLPVRPRVGAGEPSDAELVRASGAVGRIARRWPWGEGVCLRESLVLGHLLRRRDPLLRIGVARGDGDDLRAHAWLEVDGAVLGDREGFSPFAERKSAR